MPRRFFLRPTRALALSLILAAPLGAQTALPPDQAVKQAAGLFDAGRYPEAAAAYDKFLKDYPTSNQVIEAGYRYGVALYLSGQWDAAATQLRKMIAAPTSPPELVEASAGLLPGALAQKAAAIPATEGDKRKAAWAESIKEAGSFLTRFPNAPEAESIRYGRAVAHYQTAAYAEAVTDLRENLRLYAGRSETILDSQYLLALALGTQGNLALASDRPAALKAYDEAAKFLADLIAKRADLALANDAQVQLGEVLLARANAVPENERTPVLMQALEAFRAVQPKSAVVAAQQGRVEAVLARLRAAAGNPAEARRLLAQRVREAQKLAVISGRDDPRPGALLRCAEVFLQLGRHDETRVLLSALAPKLTKPEQEKSVLWNLAMSYALQGKLEPAIAAQEKFVAKHKDDPLNAPLALALGNLLTSRGDTARAQKYLDEAQRLAPQGAVAEAAVLERARVLAAGGKWDEALRAFDDFLKTNPKPDAAAAAELGRARMLRSKGDLPGALAAFTALRDKYAGRPAAEEGAFWVGYIKFEQKDLAGAATELRGFAQKFPRSPLAPAALLQVAKAQRAQGQKELALSTLAELVRGFPQAKETTLAYFERADLYQADNKPAELAATLREFVEKFPEDEKVFTAVDALAAAAAKAGRADEAAAAYEDFVKKHPKSPGAPGALRKLAELHRANAAALGRYAGLDDAKKAQWTAALDKSAAVVRRLADEHGRDPAVAGAADVFAESQLMRADAGLIPGAQVPAAIEALAGQTKDEAAAKRIRFRAAAREFAAGGDPAKALAAMKASYDESLAYSAAAVDAYVQALLRAGDAPGAEKAAQKLAKDFAPPAGTAPNAAPREIQEAQAVALYGLAKAAEARNDAAGAGRLFDQLKREYPWSPKIAEANLGIALNLRAQNKTDEALQLLANVARATTAPAEVRARGMIATAQIFEAQNNLKGAIDTYLKVATFYPATSQAADGLLIGGKLLEKQAAGLTDPAEKQRQLGIAKKAYEDLLAKHPSHPGAEEAKQRLAGLGK